MPSPEKCKPHILVVDDTPTVLSYLADLLTEEGYELTLAERGSQAWELVKTSFFDLILLDVQLPDMSGIDICAKIKKMPDKKHIPVIMVTGFGTIESAVKAMELGAFYFLTKPVQAESLLLIVKRALENSQLQRDLAQLKIEMNSGDGFAGILGKSHKMQKVFELVAQVAAHDATVLIQGSSGTGKELVARAIHQNSPRTSGPFVPIDCGAISENLLESELFGHVKGAFTGAVSDRKGVFVRAQQGTLFLDEVGNLPLALQVKLLRVLQERQITPVGSDKLIAVDARIIAATNVPLQTMVSDGTFRKDLYFRLNTVTIPLPDLKERPEDIPLLAQFFLEKHQTNGQHLTGFSKAALKSLISYDWPGNVRELEHAIEHAIIVAKGSQVLPDDLPLFLAQLKDSNRDDPTASVKRALVSLEEIERDHIAYVLQETSFNHTLAASILHIDRKSLWRKIKKYRMTE